MPRARLNKPKPLTITERVILVLAEEGIHLPKSQDRSNPKLNWIYKSVMKVQGRRPPDETDPKTMWPAIIHWLERKEHPRAHVGLMQTFKEWQPKPELLANYQRAKEARA